MTPRLTTAELEAFVADLAASPERWRHHVRHREDLRVTEQIWDDERVNAWLICWSEDQDTGFHDHDESAAAIAVISGRVREDRFRVGGEPRSHELGAGAVFTVPPVAIHRVLHAGRGRRSRSTRTRRRWCAPAPTASPPTASSSARPSPRGRAARGAGGAL